MSDSQAAPCVERLRSVVRTDGDCATHSLRPPYNHGSTFPGGRSTSPSPPHLQEHHRDEVLQRRPNRRYAESNSCRSRFAYRRNKTPRASHGLPSRTRRHKGVVIRPHPHLPCPDPHRRFRDLTSDRRNPHPSQRPPSVCAGPPLSVISHAGAAHGSLREDHRRGRRDYSFGGEIRSSRGAKISPASSTHSVHIATSGVGPVTIP